MIRDLLVLRHGKAFDAIEGNDYDRELKDQGKRKAQRVGVWLQQHDLQPDYIVTSPAPRARVTAEKCCKVMGIGTDKLTLLPRLYLADTETLIELLRTVPAPNRRVLLVGHNPGLAQLAGRLSGATGPVTLKTASLAHLVTEQSWEQLATGSARLETLLHAGDLPTGFPFPGPNGSERRDRPAYYYTQSAVIPYRRTAEGVQVLIIRSSKKRHWVVPKGIADPGMTLQVSAAKEAREEAGVEGLVDDDALGRYQVHKWGATCTVTVFPMVVKHELAEETWAERHRGRRWVSVKQAAMLLRQPQLAELTRGLSDWLDRHA